MPVWLQEHNSGDVSARLLRVEALQFGRTLIIRNRRGTVAVPAAGESSGKQMSGSTPDLLRGLDHELELVALRLDRNVVAVHGA